VDRTQKLLSLTTSPWLALQVPKSKSSIESMSIAARAEYGNIAAIAAIQAMQNFRHPAVLCVEADIA
jgi:hypothetical protein